MTHRFFPDGVPFPDGLEPSADQAGESGMMGPRDVAMLSIAISLKRIADEMTRDRIADDVMTGVAGNRVAKAIGGAITAALKEPLNAYGEAIGEAIQGQMVRGQRGIDQYGGR